MLVILFSQYVQAIHVKSTILTLKKKKKKIAASLTNRNVEIFMPVLLATILNALFELELPLTVLETQIQQFNLMAYSCMHVYIIGH